MQSRMPLPYLASCTGRVTGALIIDLSYWQALLAPRELGMMSGSSGDHHGSPEDLSCFPLRDSEMIIHSLVCFVTSNLYTSAQSAQSIVSSGLHLAAMCLPAHCPMPDTSNLKPQDRGSTQVPAYANKLVMMRPIRLTSAGAIKHGRASTCSSYRGGSGSWGADACCARWRGRVRCNAGRSTGCAAAWLTGADSRKST